MSDTPETDAARITEKNGCIATFGVSQVVSVKFARKLERERDEAREAIRALAEHGESEIQRITKERDEAREALKAWKRLTDAVEARS